VVVHEEAAQAIRDLVKLREAQPDRGIFDPDLGRAVRYPFLSNGVLAHPAYLVASPLARSARTWRSSTATASPPCTPTVPPHPGHPTRRERRPHPDHHEDPGSQEPWHVADLGHLRPRRLGRLPVRSEARRRHRRASSRQPLRAGHLDQDALDWIKTNFYKTELELGHCLRLSREGPCECDRDLTCAKFVTTPQYAPRLRERLRLERSWPTTPKNAAGNGKLGDIARP
jgi:hypothetical protein